MIRLATICALVVATLSNQVAGEPGAGEASPFYNLVASSLLSKLNDSTGSQCPLTCTCGFCNQQPPGPPPNVLSGVVVFPSSELQQVLQGPTPAQLYARPPYIRSNQQPPPSYNPSPSSYIMSIPRKYSQEYSPPKETYSPPQNYLYSPPPTPPAPTPSRPFYFTPKSPLVASCPATFYFPSTQPGSFNRPSVYSSTPPSLPPFSSPPVSKPPFPGPPPPPPPGPPSPSKEPLVTYTLRTNDGPPGNLLEAENKDCSMPTPPVLL